MACRAVARGRARLRPRVGFGAAAFTRFASEGWWARQDSNLQPDRYERPCLLDNLGELSRFSWRCLTSFCVRSRWYRWSSGGWVQFENDSKLSVICFG